MDEEEWVNHLREVLDNCSVNKPLHIIGYGNTLRQDDGVGIYIVFNLMGKISKKPKYVYIHPTSKNIEYILKKISKNSLIIICDAVKIDAEPGTVVFTEFKNLKYDFLDTHNISLSFILEKSSIIENSYLLGIVPQNVDIGEELTPIVKNSADKVIRRLTELIEKKTYMGLDKV